MRKILISIFTLFLILGVSHINIYAETEIIDYPIEFIEDKEWSIETGEFLDNENYNSTNKLRIYNDEITLINFNFSHMLFYDRSNNFIGYYNPFGSEGFENTNYLGETGLEVVIPPLAQYFSFTAYELAPNQKDITELNHHTLREVFEAGNLIPTFNNWLAVNSSNSIVSNVLTNTGNGGSNTPFAYSPNISYLDGNIYYSSVSFRVTNNLSTQIRARYHGGELDLIVNNPIQNTIYNLSGKYTAVGNNNYIHSVQHTYANSTNATNSVLQIYYDFNINQTALGISSLTVEQMDYWFNVYQDNQVWADGLSNLLFYSIEASYEREEIVEDTRSVIEKINDWFDNFGLGTFPRILVSLSLMLGTALILYFLGSNWIAILIIEFVYFVLFAVFGWFPIWLVIIVSLILLGSIYLLMKE